MDIQKLYALADQKEVPRERIVPMALASYERSTFQYGKHAYKPTDQFELSLINVVRSAVQAKKESSTATGRSPRRPPSVNDREQAAFYLRSLIVAFEEADEYDPSRHHNRPVPALYADDAEYRKLARELLQELRKLNEQVGRKQRNARSNPLLGKLLTKFLTSYASTLGKGAAVLTTATLAAFLYRAGICQEVLGHIWGQFKLPK
jgi:hypothetical protein